MGGGAEAARLVDIDNGQRVDGAVMIAAPFGQQDGTIPQEPDGVITDQLGAAVDAGGGRGVGGLDRLAVGFADAPAKRVIGEAGQAAGAATGLVDLDQAVVVIIDIAELMRPAPCPRRMAMRLPASS